MSSLTNTMFSTTGSGRLKLRVEGLKEAMDLMDTLKTKEQIQIAMAEGMEKAKEALIEVTPVGAVRRKKGGKRTKDSWKVLAMTAGSGNIVNTNPRAAYLFYGTKAAGKVEPQNSKIFFNPEIYMKARWFIHKGQPPNDKFGRFVEKGAGELAADVATGMVIGFYQKHGVVQRRANSGQFAKGFGKS